MTVATAAALAAAALFAVAAALQHRSAGLVPTVGASSGSSELSRFVLATLRHPFWLVGSLADLAGFGMHAVALHNGPLTLVQPLLVTAVVFALPLRSVIERRRPSRSELVWAVVLTVGLVLFLAVATPTGTSNKPVDGLPTIIAVVVVTLAIGGCALIGRRLEGNRSAALLGAGGGLAFAAVAGFLKVTVGTLTSAGLLGMLGGVAFYGLLATGTVGLLLNQLAYQAGPLRSSLPAITTVNPLASVILGVAVFDERFRSSPAALGGELIGLVVIVTATIALTRAEPPPSGGLLEPPPV